MDLYKLSEKDIRDYVKDSRIYHRGRMYFFNSFVEDVNILEAEGSVTARVHGSKEYIVKLYLNAKREVEDGTCTCPFYKEWRRPCKHIAAVLFEARRMIGSKYTRYRNSYKAVSAVFAKLEETKHSNYQGSRVQNHLHPTLYLTKTDERVFASLELGVGTTRSYVVRNAEEFIDAWVNGKKLFFGRHFTLDSKRQFFTGRDERIMAILRISIPRIPSCQSRKEYTGFRG